MISDARVRTLARQDGITAGLAEKNYVNSWILYAVYQSELGERLVFEGGTALSKLYFPELWRFSEDLDFTATTPLSNVETVLGKALSEVEAESGIGFEIANVYTAVNRSSISRSTCSTRQFSATETRPAWTSP